MLKEDAVLAEKCAALATEAQSAADWVERNRDLVRAESDETIRLLRRSTAAFRRLEIASRRKMCVGIFGPSQAGKSYLVSSLARSADAPLLANFGDQTLDFLEKINPSGEKEATGLVTRFTVTRPDRLPPGKPVQLRMLSETDIVKIIGNTYYADFVHDDIPDPDPSAISARLDQLSQRARGPQGDGLGVDAMTELDEYFWRNFRGNGRVKVLRTTYWPRAAELAPRLAPEDRALLFAVVWGDTQAFTDLYLRLYRALATLGFPTEAFCGLDALVPRERSIIDVATLAGLNADGDDRIEVVNADGRGASWPRATAAALTAELVIVVDRQPYDFFAHTDLLDFPGARSREKNRDVEGMLARPLGLEGLYRRGKVAYLFERYCAERELTSMLLCIRGSNQDVWDLPQMVNDWIRETHGDTPEKRTGRDVALFFVLTQFDLMLGEKGGDKGDFSARWTSRLEASLLHFFGREHSWPTQWDERGEFRNIFWVRNTTIINRGLFDYAESGAETALRGDAEAMAAAFRQGFVANPTVRRHFSDPGRAWDEVMRLNDGGIAYLAERLRPICNPELKRRQITALIAEEIRRIDGKLRRHLKTGSKDDEIEKKRAIARQVGRRVSACAQAQRFGELLRLLQIADHELYDVYFRLGHAPAADGESDADAPPAPATIIAERVSEDDIFASVFGDDGAAAAPATGAAATASRSDEKPLDEAERYAREIRSLWFSRLSEAAETMSYQRYFQIPAEDFDKFVHELKIAYGRTRLHDRLAAALRDAVRFRGAQRTRQIWKQAATAATMINAYVDWLGRDPRTVPPEQRRLRVANRERVVFERPSWNGGGYPSLAAEPTYDRDFYVDWLIAFAALVEDNAEGEEGYNRAENDALMKILDTIQHNAA
jgi:hypothetical protein